MIRLVETTSDFEVCVAIYADVEPEERVTAEQLAGSSGALLLSGEDGYAYVTRSSVTGSAYTMVRVRPAVRRRGVGSALLAAAGKHAQTFERQRLWGRIHKFDAESLRFVAARGFRQVMREVDILLAVAPGDGGWAPGIVELAQEHLVGAYRIVAEAIPETALPQLAAAPPFDEWVAQEERLGAFAVAALAGAEVVGYARLYRMPGHEHRLENGLTAVARSHRRRGIATALKRAQIAWAAEHGYTEIVSSSVEGNAAMRRVNERLGYRELPASIVVEGQLP